MPIMTQSFPLLFLGQGRYHFLSASPQRHPKPVNDGTTSGPQRDPLSLYLLRQCRSLYRAPILTLLGCFLGVCQVEDQATLFLRSCTTAHCPRKPDDVLKGRPLTKTQYLHAITLLHFVLHFSLSQTF
jgi:hypothetical protein